MAPIAKDVENPAVTTAPAAPANKPPQDAAAARPQPVALEVPVTVNGARTVDGSDKREPFSESTKTVLVFGHGAVIRLASQVAPGQLLFVTNEKTKKEVVCQVVKSKNYRTVTGYVELEFTEPAAGFWGMRFPAEKTAPALAPTSAVPVAPVAAQRPAAPISPTAPAPPKVVGAPPAPVAVKPPAPAPVPVKPVAIAPPASPPTVAKPQPPKPAVPAEIHAASEIAPRPTPPAPTTPVLAIQAAAPPQSAETPKAVPPTPAVDPTTEALKQQAARLQEQLGSLLFTETPAAKQSSPEPAVTPKPDMIPTETVQRILQGADPKPATPAAKTVQESKPAPITPKSAAVSMAVEEVKIPAWLAPLARETESGTLQGTAEAEASTDSETISNANQADSLFPNGEADSVAVQPAMFGGQLLGSSSTNEVSSSGGSKKGLFIGIAAAGILLVGGGAWYAKQPGSALSGLFAAKPTVTQTAQTTQTTQNPPAATSQPAFRPETATPVSSATNSASQPAPAKSVTPIPAAGSAVNSTPVPAVVKETTSAPRNAPPVEQPKKPVLGDVRLATPNVNRSASSQEGNVSAPSIDSGQTTSSEPLVSLAGSSVKEPEAPRPIGGDVQPAKLIKSVPPIYPPAARTQRVGGDVKIDALIDASGNVASMKVLSGPTLLHQAAMTALKQWKYEPAKLDGNPTTMHLTVTVQFRLQ